MSHRPTRTPMLHAAPIAGALCLGALAHAERIEITIDARDPVLGTAHAVVYFDTQAPPVGGDAISVTFEATEAAMSVDFADFYAHGPGHAEGFARRKPASGVISYSTQDREILLTLSTPVCTLTLEVDSPVGPFHPYMTSLPANPTAYLFDGVSDQRVRVAFTESLDDQTTRSGEATWNPVDAFTGALAYTVRVLPDPEPQGCSEADLAPPFGVVDFDDVLAFIDAFQNACP